MEPNKKPSDKLYCDVINCRSVDTAFQEMMHTKAQFGKLGGVQGYHVIQSFSQWDAGLTPALAHQIGMEFAWQCFGKQFQVLVATHLNRPHLHNHILLNAVGCFDGKKYHSCTGSYYQQIRKTSDELCRQYGLAIAQDQGRTESYSAYWAQKQGLPTIREMMRQDLDRARQAAYSWESLLLYLQRMGYTVIRGKDDRHLYLQHSLSRYKLSLHSLGNAYTEQALRQYFSDRRTEKTARCPVPQKRRAPSRKRPEEKGRSLRRLDSLPAIRGFPARYFYYLYLLGKTRRRKLCNKSCYLLRDDLISFSHYQSRAAFVWKYQIETAEQLEAHRQKTEQEMQTITSLRQEIYDQRRRTRQEELLAPMKQYTEQLRVLRHEKALCEQIAQDQVQLRQKIAAVQQAEQKNQIREERMQYEHRR